MKRTFIESLVIGSITLMVISAVFISPIIQHTTRETLKIKVVSKENVIAGTGEDAHSKYLIFTENEVFENTDAFFSGKWNSSDFQGKLKENNEYTVTVYGWRIPFFSTYRNIVEIK